MGLTFGHIIASQFDALRSGDRFFLSQHILVKKTLVKKDTWQKEVILDTWQKAVCKWYQKFSDKTSMNQILGKKFMEWILVKIKTLE